MNNLQVDKITNILNIDLICNKLFQPHDLPCNEVIARHTNFVLYSLLYYETILLVRVSLYNEFKVNTLRNYITVPVPLKANFL